MRWKVRTTHSSYLGNVRSASKANCVYQWLTPYGKKKDALEAIKRTQDIGNASRIELLDCKAGGEVSEDFSNRSGNQ